MTDTIVLLEERKEITTFLLDDGTKTLVDDVVTPTGSTLGYEYSNKCMVDDILCISTKSAIGRESLRKYTGDATEVPVGVLVNEPIVMTNGERKGSVLLLGGLYRLKLASCIVNIKAGDRIKLTPDGAIVDNAGEFLAFHPVANSDEYNYINCFQVSLGGKGEKGDTGDTGAATVILGSYDTFEELIAAHPTANEGDAFLVDGELFVWHDD
ncbi:hypothetical protein [Methanobrevibacter sp.]